MSRNKILLMVGGVLGILVIVMFFYKEPTNKSTETNYNVVKNEQILPKNLAPNSSFENIDIDSAKTVLETVENGRKVLVLDRSVKVVEGDNGKVAVVYKLYDGPRTYKLQDIINEHGEPDLILSSSTNQSNKLYVYLKKGIGFDINPFNKDIYYTLEFVPTSNDLFMINWAEFVSDTGKDINNY